MGRGGFQRLSARVLLAVLALAGSRTCAAQQLDAVSALLKDRADAVQSMAEAIERSYEKFKADPEPSSACVAAGNNACSDTLDAAICDPNYGPTNSCDCTGRKLSHSKSVVKFSERVSTAEEVQQVGCYAASGAVTETLVGLQEDFEGSLKWLYYGSVEGVLVNYPGFLWDRDRDGKCGETYDPRKRPWFMQAATGPKDVVIVVDQSGSMTSQGRMGIAKAAAITVVNSLTHVDHVAVVAFDSNAYSPNNYLVPATSSYRLSLVDWIKGLQPGSRTCYGCAFRRAQELLKVSKEQGLTSNCNTVVIFLTDGEYSDDDIEPVIAGVKENKRPNEHHFYYSLGEDAANSELKYIACKTGAVYTHVPDGDEMSLETALTGYYRLLAGIQASRQAQSVVWSEPYFSIPNVFGPVTTAVVPVYDKSQPEWLFLGTAAVDVPLCQLEAAASQLLQSGAVTAAIEQQGDTAQGCQCVNQRYRYDGREFEGCTAYHWSKPWCMTDAGCGVCDGQVQPSGCWDECNPSDAEALVSHRLYKASEVCTEADAAQTGCFAKAMRIITDHAKICDNLATGAYIYMPQSDLGDQPCSLTPGSIYAMASSGVLSTPPVRLSYGSPGVGTTFEERAGDLCGTEYDTDDNQCDACPADMFPACSREACDAGLVLKREEHGSEGVCSSEDGSTEFPVAALIGAVAGAAVVAGGCCVYRACCLNQRVEPQQPPSQPPPARPAPPPQPHPSYASQPMPAVAGVPYPQPPAGPPPPYMPPTQPAAPPPPYLGGGTEYVPPGPPPSYESSMAAYTPAYGGYAPPGGGATPNL